MAERTENGKRERSQGEVAEYWILRDMPLRVGIRAGSLYRGSQGPQVRRGPSKKWAEKSTQPQTLWDKGCL